MPPRLVRAGDVVFAARPDPMDRDFTTVQDGAIGVPFVDAAVQSGRRGEWVDASYRPPER